MKKLRNEKAHALFCDLYGAENVEENIKRYESIADGFEKTFGHKDFQFFSSPGRTEISGNHTDHNHGKVLTASIQLDCIAAAAKNDSKMIKIVSETFHQTYQIDIEDLSCEETSGTISLLKGILSGFQEKGYSIGGFYAYISSNVISSAGVSSSAAFEMLICTIIDYFFLQNQLDVVTYAKIGQYAENHYWKKQSGLLDQMACATGGLISIDFQDIKNPKVQPVDFNFQDFHYDFIIVNTGKGHADLSAQYSSIPNEMKAVAKFFHKEVLREITLQDILENLTSLRKQIGDRAVLRTLHFLEENERVTQQILAIQSKQYDRFIELIQESGNSSWKWLQNCYVMENYQEQSITLTLALTEIFLNHIKQGACRVHGGGFAGVILAVIPKEFSQKYRDYIEKEIGKDCTYLLSIRKYGSIHLDLE